MIIVRKTNRINKRFETLIELETWSRIIYCIQFIISEYNNTIYKFNTINNFSLKQIYIYNFSILLDKVSSTVITFWLLNYVFRQ